MLWRYSRHTSAAADAAAAAAFDYDHAVLILFPHTSMVVV
jgi:hypothetical protein